LLKQTLDATYDPGPLLLDGPHVSVTAIEQIISRAQAQAKHERSFSVGVKVGDQECLVRYGKDEDGDLRVLNLAGRFLHGQPTPATIYEGMPPEEIFEAIPEFHKIHKRLLETLLETLPPEPEKEVSSRQPSEKLSLRLTTAISQMIQQSTFPVVRRKRCFLQLYLKQPDPSMPNEFRIGQATSEAEREIARIIHLPALRGNPRRTYRTAAVEGRYPGPFDTYTAGVIAAWQNRNRAEPLTQLGFDLEELGLTWKAEARQLDDTQVELLVGRLPHATQGGDHDLVNIADVGFGVSQTLPVIVALLAAAPGQLVYLEQPEIHLHPRAQVRFARLLKRAVDRGARVVIETHSSLLIRGIQTLTAQGSLEPDGIALHWFTRDEKTGHTRVSTAELDETGAYGQWPEDFDDVHLAAESDYLDAAARRSANQ